MDYLQQHIKPYGEEGKKTEQVEHMFDNIVHAYDKLNHTLPLGIDRNWRRKAIAWLYPFQPQRMMDVATGTGDFAVLVCCKLQPVGLIGTNISEGMANVGREKVKKEGLSDKIPFARESCTLSSPADNDFDVITVAFGIRNSEDLDKGSPEMCRVLKPGGHLIILELITPDRSSMKQLFSTYPKVVILLPDKLLSEDSSTYRYPPDTVKVFPQGEVMKGVIAQAGFSEVNFKRLTSGTRTLYIATK